MQVVLTSTRSDDGSSERGQNLDSTGMLGLGVVILISSRLAFFFRLLVPFLCSFTLAPLLLLYRGLFALCLLLLMKPSF
ncbi:hypothetical protein ES332_D02G191700v1 [Gossypium tomentosum]|uniref:Transmembrane protein n=1 Tax=Gossypium tomentosum TaxID=34277 RepID=A0A5D2LZ69_GOSTO|nr:hypothetical protein ES332_D02G191700v1 [Gossypium tomentosum]